MLYSNDQKRKIIMDHYLNPRNKNLELNKEINETKYGETCGDILNLECIIVDNKIQKLSFNGEGCSIFIASTDILIELLKDQNLDIARKIISVYENLIDGLPISKNEEEILNELNIFNNISQFDNRKRCAKMASTWIKNIIKKYE